MIKRDFKKIVRGDVIRWNKHGDRQDIGLVWRVAGGYVHVIWEDGLKVEYAINDAEDLEHGPPTGSARCCCSLRS